MILWLMLEVVRVLDYDFEAAVVEERLFPIEYL